MYWLYTVMLPTIRKDIVYRTQRLYSDSRCAIDDDADAGDDMKIMIAKKRILLL